MINAAQHLQQVAKIAGVAVPEDCHSQHKHMILQQRRFHYQQWGNPQHPPLLFLHGGNQTSHTWDIVCAALSQRYFCVALDQRGHGDSEWSYEGDYSPHSHVKDVYALVKHLNWHKFTLIGMSMGCLNGCYFAVKNSHLLNAMVAIDAGPYVDFKGAGKIRDFVSDNLSHTNLDDYINAAMTFNPKRNPDLLKVSLRRNLRKLPNGNWTWKADRRDHGQYQAMLTAIKQLPHHLDSITCPVLVVRGGDSELLTAQNARRFCNDLPNASWVTVPEAGHSIQGDNPKGLLAELTPFLQQYAMN